MAKARQGTQGKESQLLSWAEFTRGQNIFVFACKYLHSTFQEIISGQIFLIKETLWTISRVIIGVWELKWDFKKVLVPLCESKLDVSSRAAREYGI